MRVWFTTFLGTLILFGDGARAESPSLYISSSPQPLLAPELLVSTESVSPPSTSRSLSSRILLFRIQPGFLTELRWLDGEESMPVEFRSAEEDSGPDWISVSAGNDNPYFELRQRGDPGGVGFARVHTQVQLVETERTACALGLQAVTPLGLEADGLADRDGPTVLTPALSIFHALQGGTALQAFIGKNLPLLNASSRPVRRQVQYGVALQQPLSSDISDPLHGLYFSVGALGQLGDRRDRSRNASWELLPGLHWKPADSWWMSAGYVLPVGPIKNDGSGQWQLTCSWQY